MALMAIRKDLCGHGLDPSVDSRALRDRQKFDQSIRQALWQSIASPKPAPSGLRARKHRAM